MTYHAPSSRLQVQSVATSDENDEDISGVWSKSAKVLNSLYQRYYQTLVNGVTATYGLGPPDPEEIAQRTFTKLSEKQNLHKIEDLEGYAWITARNFMLSEKRSMRVRAEYQDDFRAHETSAPCDNLDPERVLIGRGDIEIVTATLNAMSERRKAIFLACRIEGLTPEAAGKRQGVSRSSAVRHVAVATAAISEALGRIPAKTKRKGDS